MNYAVPLLHYQLQLSEGPSEEPFSLFIIQNPPRIHVEVLPSLNTLSILQFCNSFLGLESLVSRSCSRTWPSTTSSSETSQQLLAQREDFIVLDLQFPQDQLISALQSSHLSRVYSKWLVVHGSNLSTELFFIHVSGSSLLLR